LRRQGWLVLKEEPREPIPFDPARVDWSRTRAWAEGGYYARVFLNVRGREPEGTVEPSASEGARDALAAALEGLSLPGGASMRNRASRAERAYRKVRGQPPDLLVYLSELEYRSLGSVGPGPLFVEDEEESLDGCNHDWEGIFVLAGAGLPARGRIEGASLYDITPTILGALGVQGPEDLRGRDWSRA
ncbi:MAG: hypothetical protein OEY14_01005, partial [Myxococcales bacterium]|nr:hypothetical protein [Myxococcales bacterium]